MSKVSTRHGKSSFDRVYYRRFFDKYSRQEFDIYYRWHWGWVRFLDGFVDLKNGRDKRTLELGSSIGSFAKILNERGFGVTASDVSSFIVEKGKKFLKGIKFVKIDVEKGVGLKGLFDYIFAFEVLEHLKNPPKAVRNIKSKLKRGGIFVFSTPFPTTRSLSDPTHINVHPPSYWKKMGKRLGFSKVAFTYATFIPYLYRYSKYLSFGLPIKTDLPFINSTTIFFFKK